MTKMLGQRLVDANVPVRRKKSRLEGESDLAVNARTVRRRRAYKMTLLFIEYRISSVY